MQTNAAAATSVDDEDTIYTPVDAGKSAQNIYDVEHVQDFHIAETVHTSRLLRDKEQEHEDERSDQQRGKRRGDTTLKSNCRLQSQSDRTQWQSGQRQKAASKTKATTKNAALSPCCHSDVLLLTLATLVIYFTNDEQPTARGISRAKPTQTDGGRATESHQNLGAKTLSSTQHSKGKTSNQSQVQRKQEQARRNQHNTDSSTHSRIQRKIHPMARLLCRAVT